MKNWRLPVLLAVAFMAALAVPGITHAWDAAWGNTTVSYIRFWSGGLYAINWYGNSGDNNNGVQTFGMNWQAQQRTDLPNPGGKILRYPCQPSPWPYNIYVSGTTMVFRQGTGCEWYDPASGRWSGRLGNDRFPYLFTNSPVPDGQAFALEFIWRYMDYQPHGAGLTLNNRSGQAIFQIWADSGATGHESFRLQGHEVIALPNLGHEYFVRFEYHTGSYVLSVQDRWTGQWYSRQEGTSLSPNGANLGIGNSAITSGVDTWVSFYVGGLTFYRIDQRLWITSVSPSSPQPVGTQVDISARMINSEPISNLKFYVNTANDGSASGSWVLIGTANAPAGWQDFTGTVRWNTSGWSPGTHLVVVNGYTTAGTYIAWNLDSSRQYRFRIGPSPSLCITSVAPASPQSQGTYVSITARLQHYEELERIDFFVNNATDGSQNGSWTSLGTRYAPGGSWDFTATVSASSYYWYWGRHLIVVNGYTRSGTRLVWYGDSCRQHVYQVGPSPYLAITGYVGGNPSPVGASITFSARLMHYDYLDRIDFYVNQANDGSSSGAWTLLGSARPSDNVFDFTGSMTWNTSGLSPGSYLVVVNGYTKNGTQLPWTGSSSRQLVFRLGPVPSLCITGVSPGSPQPVGTGVSISARMQHYAGVGYIYYWVNSATDGTANGSWTYLGYQAAPYGSMDFIGSVTWGTSGFAYGDHLVVVTGWARDGTSMSYGSCSSYVYRVGPPSGLSIQAVSPSSPQPAGAAVNITARMSHWEYVRQLDFYANEAPDGSANGAWRLLASAVPSGNQFDYTATIVWNTSSWAHGTHLLVVNGYSKAGSALYWDQDGSRQARYTIGPGPSLAFVSVAPSSPQPVGTLISFSARMTHFHGVDRIEFLMNSANDGSPTGTWQSIGTAYGAGAMDYTGSATWNTAGWSLGMHLVVANGHSKGSDSLLWTGSSARQLLFTIGNAPSLLITDVQPPSPQVVGTRVRIDALLQHYQYVDRVEFLVNEAQDGSASGAWRSLGVSRAQGNVFSLRSTADWDTTAWAPGGTYLIAVNGYTRSGTLLPWTDDSRRQVRYRLQVDAQPPTVLPEARDADTGAVAGSDIMWVVGRPLNLVLTGRITPPPFAQSVTVLGYTYKGRNYGPNEPVSHINRLLQWSRPMEDAIDYTVRVSTRYVDGQIIERDFNLRINVTVAYTRVSR